MSEETIFHEALSKGTPQELATYLEQACANQPELRAAVEALLAAHEATGRFLASPVDGKLIIDSQLESLAKQETIVQPTLTEPQVLIAGRYTLQERIGEGGMGEVWVAKQSEPVKRKVALKLIKPGMDSRAVLARFEQERQALAIMDHPNIARVLDAGMTEAGRPFFIMELVNGLALSKFCDEARLTPRDRLELFIPICQAVQHAHQKGIVHRDLKPANILVTMIDGKPVPKVIDFGVAKATGGKIIDESMSTQFGAMVGTIEYMSPEQAGFSGEDIDTRADIYSLGVILYELMTGLRPIDSKRLKQAAVTEMFRILREEEPSKPSTRLSTNESLPSLSALRQTEPRKLMALLRGEIDWVVMKCLEKSRDRRYETANELARDIQRYLANEVVEARPPSAGYRLKKLVRRHKGKVIAASLVFLALVAGVTVSTWQAFRAIRAERAEAERTVGERRAKLDAEAKRAEADRERVRAEAGEKLANERLVQVETEKKKADEEKQIAQAVRDFLQKKLLGQASLTAQADSLQMAGESVVAAKYNPTVLELLDRAAQELASDKIEANFPRQPILQAELLRTLGLTYRSLGEKEKSLFFMKRSYELRRAHSGLNNQDTLTSMGGLATAYGLVNQHEKAIPLYEEVLQLRKAMLGADHSDTLGNMNNLAAAYARTGQRERAQRLFEEVLKTEKIELGPSHASTLATMQNLGQIYKNSGQYDRALSILEESFQLSKSKYGPDHPSTMHSAVKLVDCYQAVSQYDRALPLLEQVLAFRKARNIPENAETFGMIHNLAYCHQVKGNLPQAIKWYEEAAQGVEKQQFKFHNAVMIVRDTALCYEANNEPEKAEVWRKKLLKAVQQRSGSQSLAYASDLVTLGSDLVKHKKGVEAESLIREGLAIRMKLAPEHWRTPETQAILGASLLVQKKYAEAEPLLLKGYEGMKLYFEKIPGDYATRLRMQPCMMEAIDRLVELYITSNKPDEVKKWQAEKDKLPKPEPVKK